MKIGSMDKFYDIFPKKIFKDKDFLPDHLREIRDNVYKSQKRDISFPLYIYENRVEFYYLLKEFYPDKDKLLSWETIRIFEHETKKSIYKYSIDKRLIKQFFLIGWMEVEIYKRGRIYFKDEIIDLLSSINTDWKNITDQFIHEMNAKESLKIMDKFFYKFFQNHKIKIFHKSNNVNRHVYVNPNLCFFYYGNESQLEKSSSRLFYPFKKKLITIRFAEINESMHAGVANFDSWQNWIHVMNNQESEDNMKVESPLLPINTIAKEKELNLLKNIISKLINNNMNFSKLDQKEKDILISIQNKIPENSSFNRFIKNISFRKKIASYYHYIRTGDKTKNVIEPFKEGLSKTKKLFKEGFIHFSEWISPLWQPQYAGQLVSASDIPEQKHKFRMSDGDIQLSCLWRGAYNKSKAFIRITWKANIKSGYELWILFINTDTKVVLAEIPLGKKLKGGIVLKNDRIPFDPTKEKWATSVMIKKLKSR